MKNKYLMFLVAIFLMLIYVPSYAFFNSDVRKAKDFMKAGMYPQAVSQLEKRINEKPSDEEAHFLLGICFLQTNDFNSAEDRFNSAYRLEPDYGNKIGEEFWKIGKIFLEKENISVASSLFSKAVKYQEQLSKRIANEFFTKGKLYFERNEIQTSDYLFSLAHNYDTSIDSKIKIIKNNHKRSILERNLQYAKDRLIKIGLQPELFNVNSRKMDEWTPLIKAVKTVNASVSEIKSNESLDQYDILYWDACEGKYRDMFTRKVSTLLNKGKFLIYGGSTFCVMGPKCRYEKGKGMVNCITAAEKSNELFENYGIYIAGKREEEITNIKAKVIGNHPLINGMNEIHTSHNPTIKILDNQKVTPLAKVDDKIILAIYEDKNSEGAILASGYSYEIIFGIYVAPEGKYDPKTNPGSRDYSILNLIKNIVKYVRANEVKKIEQQLLAIKWYINHTKTNNYA